jgi:hypothetical protein
MGVQALSDDPMDAAEGGRGGGASDEERLVLRDLEELIARGRDLVDFLGPEAFEAISSAVVEGRSPVARRLQQEASSGMSPLGSPVGADKNEAQEEEV